MHDGYTLTTFDQSGPKGDIVDELLAADQSNKRALEGAMVMNPIPGETLLNRAAMEIIKLRNALGMTSN